MIANWQPANHIDPMLHENAPGRVIGIELDDIRNLLIYFIILFIYRYLNLKSKIMYLFFCHYGREHTSRCSSNSSQAIVTTCSCLHKYCCYNFCLAIDLKVIKVMCKTVMVLFTMVVKCFFFLVLMLKQWNVSYTLIMPCSLNNWSS